ncbi:glutamine amidotransferase [Labedella endophytica]|jgi:GMP synthase (glutamine-hydrolysing)|uniref:Glutamine amidotransferase n=1 Tax=Labedella endophytica TaxID=1523160 RepID=A0A3S0VIL9_9MICO|nr:glutamine amidotransferase [Labedella endophytica]RUR03411.1 glutamine amidotransferase [Labedella endophytica]
MRPFLLLTTRVEDATAANEYELFVELTGLPRTGLAHHRLDVAPLPAGFDLGDYSGVFLAGSPFTSTDPPATKSAVQVRVERELHDLLDLVARDDVPFFGACYGIGTLGRHAGAVIDRTYGERSGAVAVRLTDEGADDPVFGALPRVFDAFVGHKEAVAVLPADAVLLATGDACPVQAFRIGRNRYATQFHPELTVEAMVARVLTYSTHGYFDPTETAAVAERVARADVDASHRVLRAFAERYAS